MKKYEVPPHVTWKYILKRPTGKHRSYRIYRRHRLKNGKTQDEYIDIQAIHSLNDRLIAGTASPDTVEKELSMLIDQLYKQDGAKVLKAVANSENRKFFELYWSKEYDDSRVVQDRRTMYNDFLRALDAIGELSIQTTPVKELQKAINKLPNKKQRRVANRLNSLLRFNKSEDTLKLLPKLHEQPVFITPQELTLLLIHLPEEYKIAVQFAFYSGLRIGELFALNEMSLREPQRLWIHQQLYDNGKFGATKNRKPRHVNIYPKAVEVFHSWIELKDKLIAEGRMKKWRSIAARTVASACRRAKITPIVFHDLRHCYAIKLLEDGASLQDVADMIGDGLKVTEEYYVGFLRTNKRLDSILNIMNQE
jgi:integrase